MSKLTKRILANAPAILVVEYWDWLANAHIQLVSFATDQYLIWGIVASLLAFIAFVFGNAKVTGEQQ